MGAQGVSPSFAYSQCTGLYLGSYKAFDVLKHRHAENEEYYRQKVSKYHRQSVSYRMVSCVTPSHATNVLTHYYLRRKDISPADILGGGVPWPDDESGLHALLDGLCSAPAAGAPAGAPAAGAPAAAPAAALAAA